MGCGASNKVGPSPAPSRDTTTPGQATSNESAKDPHPHRHYGRRNKVVPAVDNSEKSLDDRSSETDRKGDGVQMQLPPSGGCAQSPEKVKSVEEKPTESSGQGGTEVVSESPRPSQAQPNQCTVTVEESTKQSETNVERSQNSMPAPEQSNCSQKDTSPMVATGQDQTDQQPSPPPVDTVSTTVNITENDKQIENEIETATALQSRTAEIDTSPCLTPSKIKKGLQFDPFCSNKNKLSQQSGDVVNCMSSCENEQSKDNVIPEAMPESDSVDGTIFNESSNQEKGVSFDQNATHIILTTPIKGRPKGPPRRPPKREVTSADEKLS